MKNQLFPQALDRTHWGTALLSLVPLLFLGPISVITSYHLWWDPAKYPWVLPLFIAIDSLLICTSFLLGAIRKFPRWSYPYATYLVFLVTFAATYLINRTPWDINHESSVLILVAALFILLTWLLPPLRPFYTNLRRDWTLLSYGLYACTLLLLSTQDHDEAPQLNLLVMLPSLIGLLGALAYLRLASASHRVGVLLLSSLLGVFFWMVPAFDGMMGSRAGFLVVLNFLLVVWGILAGLLLAPILVGLFAPPRQPA